LTRLLCEKIETIDPGFGIEVLRLAATLVQPIEFAQNVSSLIATTNSDAAHPPRPTQIQ